MPALLETYAAFPFVLDHGTGDCVYDEDGVEYFDWYGGHCVTSTGHSHPRVVNAIAEQARKLIFYSAAARLRVRDLAAETLIGYVGGAGLSNVFFCNSGAEANETACHFSWRSMWCRPSYSRATLTYSRPMLSR